MKRIIKYIGFAILVYVILWSTVFIPRQVQLPERTLSLGYPVSFVIVDFSNPDTRGGRIPVDILEQRTYSIGLSRETPPDVSWTRLILSYVILFFSIYALWTVLNKGTRRLFTEHKALAERIKRIVKYVGFAFLVYVLVWSTVIISRSAQLPERTVKLGYPVSFVTIDFSKRTPAEGRMSDYDLERGRYNITSMYEPTEVSWIRFILSYVIVFFGILALWRIAPAKYTDIIMIKRIVKYVGFAFLVYVIVWSTVLISRPVQLPERTLSLGYPVSFVTIYLRHPSAGGTPDHYLEGRGYNIKSAWETPTETSRTRFNLSYAIVFFGILALWKVFNKRIEELIFSKDFSPGHFLEGDYNGNT